MKQISREELAAMMDASVREGNMATVSRWLDRGDGCAVYENQDFGHPDLGHRKFASYGSPRAQLEVEEPPLQLPDIGGQINWRYQLVAVCPKGAA